MHIFTRFFSFLLVILHFTAPSFAGNWYVHGGLGLGKQFTYNSIAERKSLEKISNTIPAAFQGFIQNPEEDIPLFQKSIRNFFNDNANSIGTQEDFEKVFNTTLFSKKLPVVNITIRDVYHWVLPIINAQDALAKDDDILYPHRKSRLGLSAVGIGYRIAPYVSLEGSSIGIRSGITVVRRLIDPEEPRVGCRDLLIKSSVVKHTWLYGGMGTLKIGLPLSWGSVRLKMYGQVGAVVLGGNTEQILPFGLPKEHLSIPWSVAFVAGGGFQYTMSKKWSIDASWTRLISHEYIPECNLFKLSVHRML